MKHRSLKTLVISTLILILLLIGSAFLLNNFQKSNLSNSVSNSNNTVNVWIQNNSPKLSTLENYSNAIINDANNANYNGLISDCNSLNNYITINIKPISPIDSSQIKNDFNNMLNDFQGAISTCSTGANESISGTQSGDAYTLNAGAAAIISTTNSLKNANNLITTILSN